MYAQWFLKSRWWLFSSRRISVFKSICFIYSVISVFWHHFSQHLWDFLLCSASISFSWELPNQALLPGCCRSSHFIHQYPLFSWLLVCPGTGTWLQLSWNSSLGYLNLGPWRLRFFFSSGTQVVKGEAWELLWPSFSLCRTSPWTRKLELTCWES